MLGIMSKIWLKRYVDHIYQNSTGSISHPSDLVVKGEGGGRHPDFLVKLDFELADDQQTLARARIFERVPDSGCSPVPAEQSYLVNFWLNFAKSP